MDNMAYGLWPMETLRARLIAPEIPNNLPISNLKEDELMYPMRPEPEPVMAEFKFQEYGWWRDEDGKLQCGTMPRREWQGLTDEEIDAIGRNEWVGWPSYDGEFTKIYRVLEDKLKEKNDLATK